MRQITQHSNKHGMFVVSLAGNGIATSVVGSCAAAGSACNASDGVCPFDVHTCKWGILVEKRTDYLYHGFSTPKQ